ncbi:hypothetical protein BABINDRAFT_149262 [Babjeviella inositovora NRRL Y-12698]|uniref:Uncharacterized protein n=1 Tax=Babjeviella inositovora NRRL Y-12698 TaxID=984486 RepID=A0A1E3QQ25_9ASCO|nr:uncharacterized protein BABINDRAFT_149262 [Babjeviella inositovora NRRL Y-12698]ODQ79172.1 hypothetical protein BABINDRAFT_149262 [Babjeviella inositovora NRRL Y-12698]
MVHALNRALSTRIRFITCIEYAPRKFSKVPANVAFTFSLNGSTDSDISKSGKNVNLPTGVYSVDSLFQNTHSKHSVFQNRRGESLHKLISTVITLLPGVYQKL